jgi:CysZ protein
VERSPGFFAGARAVFSGLGAIARDRELRRLAMLPLAITIFLYVGGLAAGVLLADDALGLLWAKPESGFGLALWYVAVVALVAALVLVLIVTFLAVVNVVAGPFYEKMAERILRLHQVPISSLPFFPALACEIAWSVTFALPAFLLAALSLIPGIGPLFGVAALGLGGVGLASSAVGPALSATGRGYRARLSFVAGSMRLLAGMGIVMSLAILVPVVGLIAIPSAVAGATELLAKRGALGRTAIEHRNV